MRLSVRALLAGPCPVTPDRYLFRAPAADMRRWKENAAKRGMSFADLIRTALDRETEPAGTGLGVGEFILTHTPVEAAAAAVEGPDGAAAPTGDHAAEPGSPVDNLEGEAGLVQTPARPVFPPEPVIGRADLIDEARRLAGRMRR